MIAGTVEHEVGGRTYRGDWRVKDGIIHVVSDLGSKSTELNGLPVVPLARMLLRDIVNDHKLRKV